MMIVNKLPFIALFSIFQLYVDAAEQDSYAISKETVADLKQCQVLATHLNEAPENIVAVSVCMDAHLYHLSGCLPKYTFHDYGFTGLQSSVVEISKIPAQLKELAAARIKKYVIEAPSAWEKTKLARKESQIALLEEPMDAHKFVEEYCQNRSLEFARLQAMNFDIAVKVLGDGNCFYRSFLFGLILHYRNLRNGPDLDTRHKILDHLSRPREEVFGNPELFGKNDVADVGLDMIRTCLENAAFFPMGLWHSILNKPMISDAMVFALRLIVSVYGKDFADFFDQPYDEYMKVNVLTMGEYGGQVEAAVLTKFFAVSLGTADLVYAKRIVYPDSRDPLYPCDIELMFTGDHYNIFLTD